MVVVCFVCCGREKSYLELYLEIVPKPPPKIEFFEEV